MHFLVFLLLFTSGSLSNRIINFLDNSESSANSPTIPPKINYVDVFITEPVVTVAPPPNCGWMRWGAWNECTSKCGRPRQTRVRRCDGGIQGLNGCCPGAALLHKPCTSPVDDTCAYWSGWSSWSSCSTTCGSGFRRKQRDCIGEDLSLGYLCVGESVLDDTCLVSEGNWAMWQQWSTCSATCGDASRSRLREHTCRLSTDYESRDCELEDCCDISDWSNWTACSVSCGSGLQSRATRDCRGNTVNSERRTCINQTPSSDWSEWSQCSVSCGRGIRYREISGPCIEATQESEICEAGICPRWTTWSPWSSCDASCGEGARSRHRDCEYGTAGITCLGESYEFTVCTAMDPGFTPWIGWTECSASCDYGTKRRDRTHICTGDISSETVRCLVTRGSWTLWADWSSCSASCGGGTMDRRREHSCTGQLQLQQARCNTQLGFYGVWSDWSQCSQSCPGGKAFRNRDHSCGEPSQRQERNCGTLGQYTQWSQWSLCPSCYHLNEDSVLSFRQRSDSCTQRVEQQEKTCNAPRCASWAEWGSWGACSVSCGNGFRERLRQCLGSSDDCLALSGNNNEVDSCNGGEGSDIVGRWSSCSTSCGTGIQSRVVKNSCSDLGYDETRECVSNNGVYSDWSHWSSCSSSCGNGMQYRRKTHSCGEDDYVQEKSCNVLVTDRFGQWSAWTVCSADCGVGSKSRTRYKECSGQSEVQTSDCNQQPCDYIDFSHEYTEWSEWSLCSVSCGLGSRNRYRYDELSQQWPETASCDMGACCVETWTEWSPCCFFDDRNYKFRTQSNSCGGYVNPPQEMILCEDSEVPVNTCQSLMYPDLNQNEPSYGDVQTYTLSYIELTSLQTGESLRVSGYYDEDENGVRHFFTQNADYFNIVFVEGFFDAYGKYSEFLVNVQSIDETIPADETGTQNNTVAAALSGFTLTNEDDESEVLVQGYTNHLGEMITTDHYYYNARFKEGEFIGNVFHPF